MKQGLHPYGTIDIKTELDEDSNESFLTIDMKFKFQINVNEIESKKFDKLLKDIYEGEINTLELFEKLKKIKRI
jgi:hypothetical protein